jgi:uncharacterized cofD-like protein
MLKKEKSAVCFGGGNALPKAVLCVLKKYPVKITSITSMLENGGSTGQLRQDFNILPAGDISRHLIALSNAPKWKKELFYSRFGREKFPGGHVGHRFGTVFISLLEFTLKDFERALEFTHEFLELKKHRALPATLKKTHLWATLENGKTIKGEDEIDVPKKHSPKLKIKKIFLNPKAKAYKPALKAIQKADLIIIGPGDLYSSLIPCLLPEGMRKAFKKSKGKKTLIVPIMTKKGETQGFSVLDFVNETEGYMESDLDYVVFNTFYPSKKRSKSYKKSHPELLDLVKLDKHLPRKKFIGKSLLLKKGPVEHDPNKIVKTLINLII